MKKKRERKRKKGRRLYPRELLSQVKQSPKPYIDFFFGLMYTTNNVLFFPKQEKNGDFTALCPIHKIHKSQKVGQRTLFKLDYERTPSLRITYVKKGRIQGEPFWMFKCFGCGAAGDIFKLRNLCYGDSVPDVMRAVTSTWPSAMYAAASAIYNPDQMEFNFEEEEVTK